ncbi:hypothetical protein KFL_000630140 [Klebsormidium nitens]|uniref:Uncharacterized protein n=1 Tax=Klebsormidium nitens TaxID=105231 RepID=A0A1Y1HV09_KLENI|nr:hypothetical protein KFL_000630140 [Klebsormidium nitens]|eukprot:GAQ80811.1 hypothetical protein KFL_000630140 [Klebsormidium nitens]
MMNKFSDLLTGLNISVAMQRDKRSLADRRSEQGFSAANVAKPLALEFKLGATVTSQEALLDNYVRGFQALQNIAQSIPQPKQPQSSMAALSKDRVEDFARAVPIEKKSSASTVRPVPTRGACMLFGEASPTERRSFANEAAAPSESKQRIVLVPSVVELDKALELSLDPSPKLSMLAARLRADEIAMREAKPFGVELEFRDSLGSESEYTRALKDQFASPRCENEGGRSECAHQNAPYEVSPPPLLSLLSGPQNQELPEGIRRTLSKRPSQSLLTETEGDLAGPRGASAHISEERPLESSENMTSKWCGTLFTSAWSSGSKRKRDESGIDGTELLKLLEWMERSTGAGRKGERAITNLDSILEHLEEMLGFRRRGGEPVGGRGPGQVASFVSAGASGQRVVDMGRDEPVRTVPLGRGWEEECIRGVLEQIIRQGAAKKGKAAVEVGNVERFHGAELYFS